MRAYSCGAFLVILAGCGERPPRSAPVSDVAPSESPSVPAKPLLHADASAPSTVAQPGLADAGAVPISAANTAKRIRLTSPDLRAWIQARMDAGLQGTLERVRVPIARQGKGWGCVCPPNYIGVNPMMAQGPWIELVRAKGIRELRQGEVVWAEGAFGNPVKHVQYKDGEEPIEYGLVPFHVSQISPMTKGLDEDDIELERL